jgi:hypothetical protein
MFMWTGFVVLVLVVLACCCLGVAIAIRSILAIRQQSQWGAVPNTRTEVSFTTLDSVIAEAELLPDVNQRSAPQDTPDIPEESEDGTTAIVYVVMPDASMHLGQGETEALRAADKSATVPASQNSHSIQLAAAPAAGGFEASSGAQADESENVLTVNNAHGPVNSYGGEQGLEHAQIPRSQQVDRSSAPGHSTVAIARPISESAAAEAGSRDQQSSSSSQAAEGERAVAEPGCGAKNPQLRSREEEASAGTSFEEGGEVVDGSEPADGVAQADHMSSAAGLDHEPSWHEDMFHTIESVNNGPDFTIVDQCEESRA